MSKLNKVLDKLYGVPICAAATIPASIEEKIMNKNKKLKKIIKENYKEMRDLVRLQ